MMRSALRSMGILFCVCLSAPLLSATDRPVYAASTNLVWKPYLQQPTDTRVVVRWTTKTGASSVVRYSTDTSYQASVSAPARTVAALGMQMHRVELWGLQPDTTYYSRSTPT